MCVPCTARVIQLLAGTRHSLNEFVRRYGKSCAELDSGQTRTCSVTWGLEALPLILRTVIWAELKDVGHRYGVRFD